GKHRGRHLRVPGERPESRAAGERAEVWVMNEQLERVGLHQLRNRRIAEGHVGFADLARNIALGGSARARARSRRWINATKPVGSQTDGDDRRAGQNHSTTVRSGKTSCHDCPLDRVKTEPSALWLTQSQSESGRRHMCTA